MAAYVNDGSDIWKATKCLTTSVNNALQHVPRNLILTDILGNDGNR
jgi:hypothetical protein